MHNKWVVRLRIQKNRQLRRGAIFVVLSEDETLASL